MANTNTLQRSINYVTIMARGAPMSNVLTIANEPALTIGDWVRQFILSPPFAWRWNRSFTAFIATQGVDTYSLTTWASGQAYPLGTIVIDPNGNQQYVQTAGTTGGAQPVWNTMSPGTTLDGSITWQNQGSPGLGTTPIQPLGWLEKAVAIDASNTAHELGIILNLTKEPQQNQPTSICPLQDTGNGIYTFRMIPAPEQAYTVFLTQQNAAPNFVALTDLWNPVPDYLSYLYNQGLLAKTYEYMNKQEFVSEEQLFLRMVLAANSGLSETQMNIFLTERVITARQGQSGLQDSQSGRQARGGF